MIELLLKLESNPTSTSFVMHFSESKNFLSVVYLYLNEFNKRYLDCFREVLSIVGSLRWDKY